MRKLTLIAAMVLVLAGCTVEAPSELETGLTAPTPTTTPVFGYSDTVPTNSVSSESTDETAVSPGSPVPNLVDVADLTCESATPAVMAWLRDGQVTPDLRDDQVVMVRVGEGNQPGSQWWVVASAYDTNADTRSTPAWLTDAPSATRQNDPVWIPLFHGGWDSVEWSGERLERGRAAQQLALTCLPARADTPSLHEAARGSVDVGEHSFLAPAVVVSFEILSRFRH